MELTVAVLASSQIVPLLSALGIDPWDALKGGEVDPSIYLLQQAGADLGYRFEWERYGPFSQDLAVDLVDLSEGDVEQPDKLEDSLTEAVDRVMAVIEPTYAGLSKLTWIRLLASVHFLEYVSGLKVDNGDRPAYLRRGEFEQSMIETAADRVSNLARTTAT
jgi:hypothetical protein